MDSLNKSFFGSIWHAVKTAGVDVGGFFKKGCGSPFVGEWSFSCSWAGASSASAGV